LLLQLPNQPLQFSQPPCNRPQDEARPFEQRKRLYIDQLWYENLQTDSQTMVILLQMTSVEPEGHEITFHGHFQGSNADQY
jgi:hypothetical protein